MNGPAVAESPEIQSRLQFGGLLNRRGLLGEAVEIGTDRGEFAAGLLATWNGRRLWCVDPWQNNLPDYVDPIAASGRDRELDYQEAAARLAPFGERFAIVRKTSRDAANGFAAGSLDFVYLDGNHARLYVEEDIRLWWPKLRSGGVLSGHDFCFAKDPKFPWEHEVRPAVEAFFQDAGVPVWLVPEPDWPWSWYGVKP